MIIRSLRRRYQATGTVSRSNGPCSDESMSYSEAQVNALLLLVIFVKK
jgi:hypothetical protein